MTEHSEHLKLREVERNALKLLRDECGSQARLNALLLSVLQAMRDERNAKQ